MPNSQDITTQNEVFVKNYTKGMVTIECLQRNNDASIA